MVNDKQNKSQEQQGLTANNFLLKEGVASPVLCLRNENEGPREGNEALPSYSRLQTVQVHFSTEVEPLNAMPGLLVLLNRFLKIEVKFAQHKINHFKGNNSVSFSTFTVLCNHPFDVVPK